MKRQQHRSVQVSQASESLPYARQRASPNDLIPSDRDPCTHPRLASPLLCCAVQINISIAPRHAILTAGHGELRSGCSRGSNCCYLLIFALRYVDGARCVSSYTTLSTTHHRINQYLMSKTHRAQSTVYANSPLRNITTPDERPPAQSDAKTRSTTRPGLGRSTQRVSLQHAIFNALGSPEPVELLPHAPRRSPSLSDQTSISPSPPEPRKEAATYFDQTPSPGAAKDANPPTLQAERGAEMPPESWTIDEVVYKTRPGTGAQ